MSVDIWLTGAKGMVGSAILKKLNNHNYSYKIVSTGSSDLDLRDQYSTYAFVKKHQPKVAILTAARVGGVHSNSTYPAIFSLENQLMQTNALQALVDNGVQKVIFIGSSCIYPVEAPLPLSPNSLNTGELEPTNKWYAMAKLSMMSSLDAVAEQYGIAVVTLLPTNLYGPNDNFHPLDGHVIPSLLIKAHQSKMNQIDCLTVWGSGNPLREVLYVDDFADAVLAVLKGSDLPRIINVGSGHEYSIRQIAQKISDVVGLEGDLKFDDSKPDGAFRKPLDSSVINELGWFPKVDFSMGLTQTYEWLVSNYSTLREKGVLE
jgi:GDP-L-fucose synthase